ncbi:MAG: hybrid sensor histidine kinase/response regulator, partial [Bacteroidota bacterium]
ELGCDISMAVSGEAALKLVKKKTPDLILLDIMMPEMDGFTVAQRLQRNESTKDIPIIFLTAKTGHEDIMKGFSAGAIDYVTKPFFSAELVARVKTHLKLKKYRDQLLMQNDKLLRLNQEKDEFLGIAAHDLKNPLFAISLMAQQLESDRDMTISDIEEYGREINKTATRMLNIIKDLLNINAIEQNKISAEKKCIDLNEVMLDVAGSYIDIAERKDIEFDFDLKNESQCLTDAAAFKSIFDNLISNAVKYSPRKREIFIKSFENENHAYYSVKDQGPGFTEEDQNKLYDKFAKLSARPTGDELSTGLGLSIVKNYVERIGAEIELVTSPGNGAEFIIKVEKC